jgi:Fe-S oxidoreductase
MNELPIMAELNAQGKKPEYLFWVGCAGAFDDRYRKVTRAFARILNYCNISYAVLGTEETCNGDPARRAGNEMLFQMQAFRVINTFNKYGVKKIITICPHCYNIFRNEYPDIGGNYQVIHHSVFLRNLIRDGIIKFSNQTCESYLVTYHDPCYLGRMNNEYLAPREIIKAIGSKNTEMKRNRSFALCCGGGGGQMFKETEKGNKEIFIERIEEAIETGAGIVATACPFCMTMITDGIKYKNKEDDMKNYDIAELVAISLGL